MHVACFLPPFKTASLFHLRNIPWIEPPLSNFLSVPSAPRVPPSLPIDRLTISPPFLGYVGRFADIVDLEQTLDQCRFQSRDSLCHPPPPPHSYRPFLVR